MNTITVRHPFAKEYPITSRFGMRMHPVHKINKMHNGYDFKSPKSAKILAVGSGPIIKAGWQKSPKCAGYKGVGFGFRIWQRIVVGGVLYDVFYGHCSSIAVMKGQWVLKGEFIGHPGKTGTSKGIHLHLGARELYSGRWYELTFRCQGTKT